MKKNWIIIGSVALAILLVVTVFIIIGGNKPAKPNASLTGLVRNAKDSTAIADATVRIDSTETKTDKTGSFKLEGLVAGKYSIFVIAYGFKPYEFPNYELKEGINKIDEIMLEIDDSKKTNPDDSAIIPPPPLPGTKMDKKPDFKKFSDFSNCTITVAIGEKGSGNSQITTYSYSNGIAKMENPMILDRENPLNSVIYVTKEKMITHPGKDSGWIAMPKPQIDPKNGEYALIENTPKMFIDFLFKAISDKTTTVNYIGKVNRDYGQVNRYYIVTDANGALFDGEVFAPVDGKLKDTIIEFSGRMLIGGAGDKTELVISKISKTAAIVLPKDVKTVDAPTPPAVKFEPNKQNSNQPPEKKNP